MSGAEIDWSALPAPTDDRGADHLLGAAVPPVTLPATDGSTVDVSTLDGMSVVFAYPKTARPGVALPENWDEIPGARGCTPEACAFRDAAGDLRALGVRRVFGLSTQSTEWQQEAVERLKLPYPLLSDAALAMTKAMRLPTFEAEGETLLRRLTLVIEKGRVARVFYPVFPPDAAAEKVMGWLRTCDAR